MEANLQLDFELKTQAPSASDSYSLVIQAWGYHFPFVSLSLLTDKRKSLFLRTPPSPHPPPTPDAV